MWWIIVACSFAVTLSEPVKRQAGAGGGAVAEMEFAIRLAGSAYPHEGRVEVMVNNEWGTVCSTGWDVNDVQVVCRMLGYHYGGTPVFNAERFGQGHGMIFLDAVACTGVESSLRNCDHAGFTANMCTHENDAGVICNSAGSVNPAPPLVHQPPVVSTSHLSVRLSGGTSHSEGRVEVYASGRWWSVCDDGWDTADAQVVCRQLNLPGGEVVPSTHFNFGYGLTDVWMTEVHCAGYESSLDQCQSYTGGNHGCNGAIEAAGVRCPGQTAIGPVPVQPVIPSYGGIEVRLSSGFTANDGVLETLYQGQWVAMCAEDFNNNEATVACRQLGFRNGEKANPQQYTYNHYNAYHQKVNAIRCDGYESRLDQCTRLDSYNQNTACYYQQPAAVVCSHGGFIDPQQFPTIPVPPRTPSTRVRLVGGSDYREGLVYVRNADSWGTVCTSPYDVHSTANANVICHELGYYSGSQILSTNIYGEGIGLIWMANVRCAGNEASIVDCPHDGFGNSVGCTHNQDMAVRCR